MSLISILLYNLGIRLYYWSVYIASFFSKKAKSWIAGRKKFFGRLASFTPSAHGRRIWFHCSSLGEFEQARPLIELIRKRHPNHKLILTFFSPSGFEVRQFYDGVDFVGYLPSDTWYNAQSLVKMLEPSFVIWVKYDFWYNILNELHSNGIPVVLISSVFRPDQIFFKWYGSLHRKMLGYFSKIYVQNEASLHLLKTLQIESEVCSDTRFDSVYNVMSRHKAMDSVAVFKGDKKIFIAGSTWAKDVDIICEMIMNDPFGGRYRYIIAPHDVSKENIDYIISKLKGKKKALLSRLTIHHENKFDVLIVDSIGRLSSLYYYGDIAYIGGGFNASVHNILEPAVYGMPVIFGPNYQKSEEAKTMLSHPEWQAAHTVKNYPELLSTVRSLVDNDGKNLKTGSERAKEYVKNNTGGTEKIYSYLLSNYLL
jgi:3-deoxy-D-manno-octulosonic-acid transferase